MAPTPYQENHYDPFGLNLVGIEQTDVPNSAFQYNGKEKQEDFGLNWTDYGARMYDAQLGRWHSVDPSAATYFNVSPFIYVNNNPILCIDPDGRDWIVSTWHNKKGELQINLTYYGVIVNSSDKTFNVNNFISNQQQEFSNVFNHGNVHAKLLLREVGNSSQRNDFESVIDVRSSNEFTTNNDGSHVGGDSKPGGKYIRLNANDINKDGSFNDRKNLVHEIGHTGGLLHPFDKQSTVNFVNGNSTPANSQRVINESGTPAEEANFMNYTREGIANFPTLPNGTYYFNNTVGAATLGQTQTIINNIYNGNLNSSADIPKIIHKKRD